MRFQLLGGVRAWVDGQRVGLGVRKQRFVFAVLALEVNRLLPTDRLLDLLWPEQPPVTARQMIYTYVSGLRAILDGRQRTSRTVDLVGGSGGYELRCDPDLIDVHRFRRLAAAARAQDDQARVATLDEALRLWQGPPLAGVTDEPTRSRLCGHLAEARLATVEDRIETLLQLGRHHELIDELTALVREHPLRQRLTSQLMLALHRAGRTAGALRAYDHARRTLAEELGIDPSAALQRLHREILRADPDLIVTTAERRAPALPHPAQLPADPPLFTGREDELNQLLRLATEGQQVPPASVVTCAIDGMAGVGKTTLAIHAAHRLATHYPDGQLFVDLHGHAQGMPPVEPADALDRMLRALGIPGEQIPAQLDARAALYRSRLANQRILVLLDNAAAEAQVVPLLPGAPTCLVLVTSRRYLTGLDHTHTLSLETLPPADAVALFARVVGEHRLAEEPPELVAEAVELCGRLPLAIRIAAARLRARSAWGVAQLIARLREQPRRLTELAAGPRSVTAALDLSYQQLAAEAQRAYRLLGLHPGPDFATHAGAALTGATVAQAGRLLDQLVDVNLLQEPTPGRYAFHDLTRIHAAETAGRVDTEPDRRSALVRLFDHYRQWASHAMDSAHPYERDRRPQIPAPVGMPAPDLSDPTVANAWLDTELSSLLAVAGHAADVGSPDHTVHLSAILGRHLRTRGHYSYAQALHDRALQISTAAGDRPGEIDALLGLGHILRVQAGYGSAASYFERAYAATRAASDRAREVDARLGLGHIQLLYGRYDQAAEHYTNALAVGRATGDGNSAGEVEALLGLGYIQCIYGEDDQASTHFERAFEASRATSNDVGAVHALRSLGRLHRLHGRYEQAIGDLTQARELARATGSHVGELSTIVGLADTYRLLDRFDEAADSYRQAVALARTTSNRNWHLEAVHGMGRLHQAAGSPDLALVCHQQALDLANELGQPVDQARAHDGLAHAHQALDHPGSARHHWEDALGILARLGTEHTGDEKTSVPSIRAHLARLDRRHEELT